MGIPGASQTAATTDDPLPEAVALAGGAADAGVPLRLLGGLAVRVACPDFPPRFRRDQDIDFACLSKGRKEVASYLERSGCEPDRRFNSLNGSSLIAERPDLAPPNAAFDPVAQAQRLLESAEAAPKGLKWRLRSNVGALYAYSTTFGVPIVPVAGVITIGLLGFNLFEWLHNATYGVNKGPSLVYMGAMYVLAIVVFVVARIVRSRQGIDLSLINKEIPVE